eukprot:SAG31_NODE_361_length_16995_cov_9.316229_4_plen_2774_part_00
MYTPTSLVLDSTQSIDDQTVIAFMTDWTCPEDVDACGLDYVPKSKAFGDFYSEGYSAIVGNVSNATEAEQSNKLTVKGGRTIDSADQGHANMRLAAGVLRDAPVGIIAPTGSSTLAWSVWTNGSTWEGDGATFAPGTNSSFTLSRSNRTQLYMPSSGTLTGNGFVGADFSGAGLGTQPLVLTVDGSGTPITVSLTAAMSTAGDVVAALNADGAFAAAAVASVDGSEVKITSRTTGPLSSVAIETGSSGANAQALFGSSPAVQSGAPAVRMSSALEMAHNGIATWSASEHTVNGSDATFHTLNGIVGSKASGDLSMTSDGGVIMDDTFATVQSSDDESSLRLVAGGNPVVTSFTASTHATIITDDSLVLAAVPSATVAEGDTVTGTNIPAGTTIVSIIDETNFILSSTPDLTGIPGGDTITFSRISDGVASNATITITARQTANSTAKMSLTTGTGSFTFKLTDGSNLTVASEADWRPDVGPPFHIPADEGRRQMESIDARLNTMAVALDGMTAFGVTQVLLNQLPSCRGNDDGSRVPCTLNAANSACAVQGGNCAYAATNIELSAPQTFSDQTRLTFSTTVTTATVDGNVAGTAVALGGANADIEIGHVVSGTGIAETITVDATTGICTGTNDGTGTTAITGAPVSGTTMTLADGNSDVTSGQVVTGDSISGTTTVVSFTGTCTGTNDGSGIFYAAVDGSVAATNTVVLAGAVGHPSISSGLLLTGPMLPGGNVLVTSVSGICTGDDDGTNSVTPVACATNADDTACAVVGGNCLFGTTVIELSSDQTIEDGTVLAFSTPCTTNVGNTACAVQGGNCLFEATSLVLDTTQTIAAGVELTFEMPCADNAQSNGCAVLAAGNNCVYAASAVVLSHSQIISDATELTFSAAATTGIARGDVTGSSVALEVANTNVEVGQVVTGTGIDGTASVVATTGLCSGNDDGTRTACILNSGSTACNVEGGDCVFTARTLTTSCPASHTQEEAATSAEVNGDVSGVAVTLANANTLVAVGQGIVAISIDPTLGVKVASVSGTCVGTDDGTGTACTTNAAGTACQVFGGDCAFAADAVVLDQSVSLTSGVTVTFTQEVTNCQREAAGETVGRLETSEAGLVVMGTDGGDTRPRVLSVTSGDATSSLQVRSSGNNSAVVMTPGEWGSSAVMFGEYSSLTGYAGEANANQFAMRAEHQESIHCGLEYADSDCFSILLRRGCEDATPPAGIHRSATDCPTVVAELLSTPLSPTTVLSSTNDNYTCSDSLVDFGLMPTCTGTDDGSRVACATNSGGTACVVAAGNCEFGVTTLALSSSESIPDETVLTFSDAVTTGVVNGDVNDIQAAVLAVPNSAVVPGQIVTGAGIAGTITVISTSGTCSGTDDGSGTTATVAAGVSSSAVIQITSPNPDIRAGHTVTGALAPGGALSVVSTTGQCTGTDDGSGRIYARVLGRVESSTTVNLQSSATYAGSDFIAYNFASDGSESLFLKIDGGAWVTVSFSDNIGSAADARDLLNANGAFFSAATANVDASGHLSMASKSYGAESSIVVGPSSGRNVKLLFGMEPVYIAGRSNAGIASGKVVSGTLPTAGTYTGGSPSICNPAGYCDTVVGFTAHDFGTHGAEPLALTVDGSGTPITVSLTAAMSSAGDVVAALNADGAFAAAAVASVDGSEVKITSRTTGPLSSVAIETGSSGANAQAIFGTSPTIIDGTTGTLTPGGTVLVVDVTGVCIGDDDGTNVVPVPCTTNSANTACAVAGGDCRFIPTAVELDSAQTIGDGAELTFTTPCALAATNDECAVQGGNCLYSATQVVLSSPQTVNSGETLAFTSACTINVGGYACAVTESGNNCIYAATDIVLSEVQTVSDGTLLTFSGPTVIATATTSGGTFSTATATIADSNPNIRSGQILSGAFTMTQTVSVGLTSGVCSGDDDGTRTPCTLNGDSTGCAASGPLGDCIFDPVTLSESCPVTCRACPAATPSVALTTVSFDRVPLDGVATESSQYLLNSATKAFDSDNTTVWDGCCILVTEQWLGYTQAQQYPVVGYALMTGGRPTDDDPDVAMGGWPSSWNIQGRNSDFDPWVTIDTQMNQPQLTALTYFTFSNTLTFQQFRWQFLANDGGPTPTDRHVVVREARLMEQGNVPLLSMKKLGVKTATNASAAFPMGLNTTLSSTLGSNTDDPIAMNGKISSSTTLMFSPSGNTSRWESHSISLVLPSTAPNNTWLGFEPVTPNSSVLTNASHNSSLTGIGNLTGGSIGLGFGGINITANISVNNINTGGHISVNGDTNLQGDVTVGSAGSVGSVTGSDVVPYDFATLGAQPLIFTIDGNAIPITVSMAENVQSAADVESALTANAAFAVVATAAVDGNTVKVSSRLQGEGSAVVLETASGPDAQLLFGSSPTTVAGVEATIDDPDRARTTFSGRVTAYPRDTPEDNARLAEVAALRAVVSTAELVANSAGADSDSFRFHGSAYGCIEHANWANTGGDLSFYCSSDNAVYGDSSSGSLVLPAVACPKTCATRSLMVAKQALADALSATSLRMQNNITRLLLVDSSNPAEAMSVKFYAEFLDPYFYPRIAQGNRSMIVPDIPTGGDLFVSNMIEAEVNNAGVAAVDGSSGTIILGASSGMLPLEAGQRREIRLLNSFVKTSSSIVATLNDPGVNGWPAVTSVRVDTIDGGCIFVLENLHPNEDTQDPLAAASAVPPQTFYPLKIGFAIMTPSADHLSSDGDGCDPDPCQNSGTCNDQEFGFTCDCTTGWNGPTCGESDTGYTFFSIPVSDSQPSGHAFVGQ